MRSDTRGINVVMAIAAVGVAVAFLVVTLAVVFVFVAPRFSCSLTVILKDPNGRPAFGVPIEVSQLYTVLKKAVTDAGGSYTFTGLPCSSVAVQWGGGSWVVSAKRVVDFSTGPSSQTITSVAYPRI